MMQSGNMELSPITHKRLTKIVAIILALLLCMPTASFALEPNQKSEESAYSQEEPVELVSEAAANNLDKAENDFNAAAQDSLDAMLPNDAVYGEDVSEVGKTNSNEANIDAQAAGSLSLSVEYDAASLKCGVPVTFTMHASGGSGSYKYLQNYMLVNLNGSYTDDADWTRMSYTERNTFEYTFVASGTYQMRLYVMDTTTRDTARIVKTLTITDSNYPSVDQIATSFAQDCLAQGYATDCEKALYVHDRIINNATYDHSLLYDGESGVLARGTGTCESYHRAFSLIMSKLGIPCERATGNGHVWSCVKLDGQWTQIDLTWDGEEQKDEYLYLRHLYFGLTDDLMKTAHSDHVAASNRLCSSYQNNYFLRSGEIKRWSDPVKEQIANQLAAGKTEFTVSAEYNMYPSVYDILYPLVAYQLLQEDWNLSDRNVDVTFVKTGSTNGYYSVLVTCNHTNYPAAWQYDSSQHWKLCSTCSLKGNVDKHSFGSWQQDSNQHWRCCSVCGFKESSTAHSFGSWQSSVSQHWKVCTVCGAKSSVSNHSFGAWQHDSKQHWRYCTTCNTKENASNHSFGSWKTTKNPTATVAGIKERSCTACGYKETQSIPATGTTVKPNPNVPAQTIIPGTYIIKTALNTGRALDISAASKSNGGNTQIYQNNNTAAQRFRVSYDSLTGYYTFTNINSGKVLDVSGAKAANGTNVQQYQSNGTLAQRWIVTGDSKIGYTITSALNRSFVLDVAGAANRNGANVQIYRSNNTKAQKFFFTRTDAGKTIDNGTFVIESGVLSSKALDIAGASFKNGANAQLYSKNGTAAQKFRINFDPSTNYYVITNVNSGKVLDVSGAKAANGTNVQQYQSNGTLAQRWAITGSNSSGYTIASAIDRSYVLDIAGASQKNGANVQVYRSNNTKAQKYYLRKL